jgi:carbon-monoxide dehydrogenase medium subunit
MIPGAFDYHRPASVAEAVSLLATLGDDARLIAGGHSLIPMMKLRLAVPQHLIDLQHIAELKQIDVSGRTVTLGAMATQTDMIASNALHKVCPIIRDTSLQIADPQIRNMGTVGGNVANGDPGNDLPALMQALDATYIVHSQSGERELPARTFYEAPFFTALDDSEVLTRIRFDAPSEGHGYAYLKQKRKVGDYATAAAAVMLEMSAGKCTNAAIALTNVGDTPLYAKDACDALIGSNVDSDAVNQAVDAAKAITNPASDGRGPSDYRTHVAGVMVRRAIELAKSRVR